MGLEFVIRTTRSAARAAQIARSAFFACWAFVAWRAFVAWCAFVAIAPSLGAEPADASRRVAARVTGLFSPDRVDDLRAVLAARPDIKLTRVDFATTEAEFDLSQAKEFVGAKPEQIIERLNNLLRGESQATFGARPPLTMPRERLERVEIAAAGLDCKACALAAYEAVLRVEGVEQATASFKEGRVVAWLAPGKADRAAVEEALRQLGVEIGPAPASGAH